MLLLRLIHHFHSLARKRGIQHLDGYFDGIKSAVWPQLHVVSAGGYPLLAVCLRGKSERRGVQGGICTILCLCTRVYRPALPCRSWTIIVAAWLPPRQIPQEASTHIMYVVDHEWVGSVGSLTWCFFSTSSRFIQDNSLSVASFCVYISICLFPDVHAQITRRFAELSASLHTINMRDINDLSPTLAQLRNQMERLVGVPLWGSCLAC